MPSPLVAALAQAVIEQHAKRAGLVGELVGSVGAMGHGHDAGESAGDCVELSVVAGGRTAEAGL